MAEGKRKDSSYEQLFVSFSEPVERWLRRFLIFLALVLLVVQALLQVPGIRKAVTRTDPLEGQPLVQKNSENR